MRRLLLVAVVVAWLPAVLATRLTAREGDTQVEELLKKAEADWITASLRRDKVWLEGFLADEVTVTHPTSGKVKHKAEEIADTIDPTMAAESMTLGEMKVRVFGQPPLLGVVTGMSSETGGGAHLTDRDRSYLFTDTFLKRDGRWQLIASHSSRLPR